MNKALQALIDSILLAAGAGELGGSTYTPVAPLVRSLPRGTRAAAIERERDIAANLARQPESHGRKQAL
jgi:hypothetical protein